MKTKEINGTPIVSFRDIKIGQCFGISGEVYLRTNPRSGISGVLNAVNLSCNEIMYIEEDEIVIPLTAYVNYHK